jgi:hypothetical protein
VHVGYRRVCRLLVNYLSHQGSHRRCSTNRYMLSALIHVQD